jgi:hypothetical protein
MQTSIARQSRILFTWVACLLLASTGGLSRSAIALQSLQQRLAGQILKKQTQQVVNKQVQQVVNKQVQQVVNKQVQQIVNKQVEQVVNKQVEQVANKQIGQAVNKALANPGSLGTSSDHLPGHTLISPTRPTSPTVGPVLKERPVDTVVSGAPAVHPTDHLPIQQPTSQLPQSPGSFLPGSSLRPTSPLNGNLGGYGVGGHSPTNFVVGSIREPGIHPLEPHPIESLRPGLPIDPLRLVLPKPIPSHPTLGIILPPPTVVIAPRPKPVVILPAPSTAEILALGQAPRVVVAPNVVPAVGLAVSPASQQFIAANAQLTAAENTCAQADAYQNYVTSVVNRNNAIGQGIDQILQTLADNTSNPDLQQTLTDAIGQPDAIDDALQQQLQNMADSFEGNCQSQMAAAQATLAAVTTPPPSQNDPNNQ